ncbi:soluble lytic murein transglycosylase-like protein [Symbiobacterium terraclitae]|uniref:Soluble lytic murein transglycosylase-like protein n=1 Tax=Symbiobacterium terraclitae TaxID=557451 RepID=A0ABS4JUK7_9FIRM|nr:lytic transglycosylase domain-containing protein [Symbiobacterium terraclitae]MBP2019226.1 soluble lytic murein transglycosylase-like protein [Symbiobacterium terraclitae]
MLLRLLRRRRSIWAALALGLAAVPTMFAGTAAAPAEGSDPNLAEPELDPMAAPPPDPAELERARLQSQAELIADLAPEKYRLLVITTAERYGVDPRLVAAIITVESRWDPDAVGAHGEQGLMQILPSTGEWLAGVMGLTEYRLSDPATSVEMGTFYLAALIREYGSADVALAVYNGGPRAAEGWQGNAYRRRVLTAYQGVAVVERAW